MGAVSPRRGLVPDPRPRRRDAREARPDARTVRHRSPHATPCSRSAVACGCRSSIPNCASHRRIDGGSSSAKSPASPSSARPHWEARTTPSPSMPTCPPMPAESSMRWAGWPAGSPATSTTGSCATSTTVSSFPAPRFARRPHSRPGPRPSSSRPVMPSRDQPDRSTSSCESGMRLSRRAGCRSARRCSLPQTIALTSVLVSAPRCRSTTTTRRPSPFGGRIERLSVEYT